MRFLERESRWERNRERATVAIAVGAGVALVGGVVAWRLLRARRGAEGQTEAVLTRLEEDVVDLLRADERISGQPIEVAALTDGIVELSGAVETQEDSDRAVAIARRAQRVRTVLNRLDVLEEIDRAENARHLPEGPGTPRADTRWLGLGVGMGRRRQGRETDPDRRDDRVDIVSSELGVDRVVENPSEPLDKIPNAVEGHATAAHSGPDDHGTVSDVSHRRLGNAQPFPQDYRTPTQQNVPPGTELDIEQAGLEGELRSRGPEEH